MNATDHPKAPLALVIDDEPQIQRLLTVALESNHYRVVAAGDGQSGLGAAAQQRADIIILDLGLPDINGLEVLRQIRTWTQIPIIILTVHDEEADKIEALDSGADDYVTKPFNTGELLARVRAALRRASSATAEEPVFTAGNITVDFASRQISRNGRPVKLTATEFAMLALFIRHAGKVLTHRHILREIWGVGHEGDTQYLRVYVKRLREKLEGHRCQNSMLVTEAGVGYRLKT